jgi:hypothetical protein
MNLISRWQYNTGYRKRAIRRPSRLHDLYNPDEPRRQPDPACSRDCMVRENLHRRQLGLDLVPGGHDRSLRGVSSTCPY